MRRAAALSTLVLGVWIWTARAPAARQALPPLDLEITAATRLLVLAPHPDDEALGAAGLISRVIAKGGVVQVALLTSGDGFPEAVKAAEHVAAPKSSNYRGFGRLREQETRWAMVGLGVDPNRIAFLGFPDAGLCLLASTYLSDKHRPFESPYTDRTRPPATEQTVRGVRYRGIDVRLEIERLAAAFAPTVLVLPHPDDEHPDHCATQIFARDALHAIRLRLPALRVLYYLVHFGQWPLDVAAGGDLEPPADFQPADGRWVSLTLTRDEAAAKEQAIRNYATQIQIIGSFMRSFARDNELFVEGEPASLPECWCDGRNVATEAPPPPNHPRP